MYAERIAEILRKLAKAQDLPGIERELGASKHKFQLDPPMPESEVLAYEKRHGVVLPEDYRRFLLLGGASGAGPFYGLDPLSLEDCWFEEEIREEGYRAAPCPLVDSDALKQAWRATRERDARLARGIVKVGAGPCDAWNMYLPWEWSDWGKGSIQICDQGCTFVGRLIISGEARGRIVYLDAQGWRPPYFVKDLNFIDWYERWLDILLGGTPTGWFGLDNPAYESQATV